jgi:hypothetical protein
MYSFHKLPLLRDQPSDKTWDRGYDNVLLGQGYRTPRGAVIDEYGATMGWWLAGEQKNSEKNLLQCHFGHCEFYSKSPGIEVGSAR